MINIKVLLLLLVNVNVCYNQFQVFSRCFLVCLFLPLHVESRPENMIVPHFIYSKSYIRYCDVKRKDMAPDDFMNRIVGVTVLNSPSGQVVAPGIIFSPNHILTSFNPFRELIFKVDKSIMVVADYRAKLYKNGSFIGYYMLDTKFACARQVVPLEDAEITKGEWWHGTDHKHSPVHDLMVIRTEPFRDFLEQESVDMKRKFGYDCEHIGFTETKLAGINHKMTDKLKFVSLGLIKRNIQRPNILMKVEIERKESIQNCREWFPREWGYFICISNDNDYVTIGSGAFLFSDNRVIGVGSFALWKGNASILVFTDVRPYKKNIKLTCTNTDEKP